MKQNILDAAYWNQRYLNNNTPWDIDAPSRPLVAYIDQLTDKNTKILIPGAGNAHEAAYLHDKGFTDVWVCDWAQTAIDRFMKSHPFFPSDKLICSDFFALNESYDLILEQTFFCALPPDIRTAYVQKTADLLHQNGKLVGVLFGINFEKAGPPFGGTQQEYQKLFEPYFDIKTLAPCYNSIQPRAGSELFIVFQKKD